MVVRIHKGLRELRLLGPDGAVVMKAPIALGWEPLGPKDREGDGKTPEGVYTLCLTKEAGRHGQSLGLSYPGVPDADAALAEGRIDRPTHEAILAAHRRQPAPWGSPWGEIYIHGAARRVGPGAASPWGETWTPLCPQGPHRPVEILP